MIDDIFKFKMIYIGWYAGAKTNIMKLNRNERQALYLALECQAPA